MDTTTDPFQPHALHPNSRAQSHHHPTHTTQAHTLSRDGSSGTSHSQRTDTLTENGRGFSERGRTSSQGGHSHVNDDRGSDRGSERGSDRGGSKATGPSGSNGDQNQAGVPFRAGGRAAPQVQQTMHASGAAASSKAEQVAAATAAAAAAMRPSHRGSSRNAAASSSANAGSPATTASGKGTPVAGHPQNAPGQSQAGTGHQGGPSLNASIPNGVMSKSNQQQQQHQSKQANARMLNGNAAAFVPASVSGAMPSISSSMSLTSTGSGALNGHASHANHTSYRNAAAGVSTAASVLPSSTSSALSQGERGPSCQGSLSPRQSVSSGLHVTEAAAPSSPPHGKGKSMQSSRAGYSGSKAKQPSPSPAPFISPDAPKVGCISVMRLLFMNQPLAFVALTNLLVPFLCVVVFLLVRHSYLHHSQMRVFIIKSLLVAQTHGQSGVADSTGLEGFAHMGLIDDLLA